MNIEDIKIKDNTTKVKESKEKKLKKNSNKIVRGKDGKLKKGVVLNPKGRPKGTYSFIPMLKRELKRLDGMTNKTKGQMVVEKLIDKAIKDNDIQAMKELFNRIDGMPKQSLDVEAKIETYDWGQYKD